MIFTSRILSRQRRAKGRVSATRLSVIGATVATGVALTLGALVLPAQGATQYADIDRDNLKTHSGRLEIKQDGAVIDGLLVKGYIDIKADNVTIKNTIVESANINSIRIYEGSTGAEIYNSQVFCVGERSNGVVHGDYTADSVDLFDCRHDFLFSDDRPAVITNSSVDGVAYRHGALPSGPSESPSHEPTPDPTPTVTPDPTPTVTPDPTPTVTPDPTQSPTPAPSPSSSAPSEPSPAPSQGSSGNGFPTLATTGVPAGVSLRTSGSVVVTQPGTVIDGLDVRGSIEIQADNVTIRNSRVSTDARYPIRVHSGVTGALIDHVEVSNEGSDGKGIYFSGGSGTVRYSNIHSAEDGIFITADNVTVEHSYIHSLTRHPGAHPDAIQIRGGDNITIRHNNLQAYNTATGVSNAAIQIGSLVGDQIDNLRVTDNLMNGGHVTVNGGGRGEVASAVYSGNRFGRDFQYGVSGNIQNSVWDASNVYDDNGQPAR